MAETTVLPQVWYVRIPDPDCKQSIDQCQGAAVQIKDYNVQSLLWMQDTNRDNVLDWRDLPKPYSAQEAATLISQKWIDAQTVSNSASIFKSPRAVLDWVRFDKAVHTAYKSAQFVNSLPSHTVIDGLLNSEHQFDGDDWLKLTNIYAPHVEALQAQMEAAYTTLWSFTQSAEIFAHEVLKFEGVVANRKYIVDPSSLPEGMAQEFTALLRMMTQVDAFYSANYFVCAGDDCPTNASSARPLVNHSHNGQILTCKVTEKEQSASEPGCGALLEPSWAPYSPRLTFPEGARTLAGIPYPAAI